MALSPLVNYFTPLLNPAYANVWTPDIFWRLVLYWHGGLFIPWITALAVVVCMKFKLNAMPGVAGRLIKESVFIGGFIAVPLAGIAGIFDVYDRFALGVPLWAQITAFMIGDEMAVALIVAMLVYPAVYGGGYRHVGMPYYTVFFGVVGALTSAIMGHVGGWISWFGPNPPIVAQYVNATMYPVTGYYNSTAVIMFTESIVGSHSHLMLVALMAGVVALVAASFGFYENWSRGTRLVANFGFAVMILSLLTGIWMYVVSGLGNYAIPTFFVSGPGGINGIAADDLVTGAVGFGAFFVLVGLFAHSRGALTGEGKPLFRDPLFLSIMVGWLFIYLVIPITGYYIEMHHDFFFVNGTSFDDAFNRFHQDFGFYTLPALVTLVLALDSYGISGRIRRYSGYLLLAGMTIAFVFGESYTMITLSSAFLYAAVFGGILMGLGALVGAVYLESQAPRPGVVQPSAKVS
jgi:hypothetical protein